MTVSPGSWTLVTAPVLEPVTLDQIRDHLRIDVTDEDGELEEIISDSREALESEYEMGFITQTWDFFMDGFPNPWGLGNGLWRPQMGRDYNSWIGAIVLGRRPVQSVTSIKYVDSSGTITTLVANTDYVLDAPGARVVPAFGKAWPAVTLQPVNGVQIRVVLGYGTTAASVPRPVRRSMRLMCGHFYENREQVLLEQRIRPIDIPRGVTQLMSPLDWRVYAA